MHSCERKNIIISFRVTFTFTRKYNIFFNLYFLKQKILTFFKKLFGLVCIGLSPDAGRDFALLKGSPESCKIQKDFSWLWSKVHFTLTGLLQGVLKLFPLFESSNHQGVEKWEDRGTLKVSWLGQKPVSRWQYIGPPACMSMSYLPKNSLSKDKSDNYQLETYKRTFDHHLSISHPWFKIVRNCTTFHIPNTDIFVTSKVMLWIPGYLGVIIIIYSQ